MQYQKLLYKQAVDVRESQQAPAVEYTEQEKKRIKTLQEALSGMFDARSYLGNQFRAEHKAGTAKGDEFKKLGSRAEQAEFRKRWLELKLKEVTEKKTFSQTWSRVDRTKGRYRTLGKLVKDFGGWQSSEALQGACCAASKCALLGEP